MSKRKQQIGWYRTKRIKTIPASYFVIFGQRSNGKTYSIKEEIRDEIYNGGQFFYIRRKHSHITRSKMFSLFEDVSDSCVEKLGDYIKYSTEKGFYINRNGEDKTVGYVGSIEDAYDLKGLNYDGVTLIYFDEFVDYDYFTDETTRFLHLISTIVRERKNVKIFMTANTISKYCPYFKLMRIEIDKIKQGEIKHIIHQRGATVTYEYCAEKVDEIGAFKTHKYLGFDDDLTVDMILYGEWEYRTTNIKNIDGIGWSCQRHLIPLYVTSMEKVYEISIYKNKYPIAFVRRINTQNGEVRKTIKYNLTYDRTLTLTHKGNIVPSFTNISTFIDENTKELMKIFNECIRSTRVVYDSYQTGTEFMVAYNGIIKKAPN